MKKLIPISILTILTALIWNCGGQDNARSAKRQPFVPKEKDPRPGDPANTTQEIFFKENVRPLLQQQPCTVCHSPNSSSCSLDILDYKVAVTLIRSPNNATKETNNFYTRMNTGEAHQDFACTESNQSEVCKAIQKWWEKESKEPLTPPERQCNGKPSPFPSPSPMPPPGPPEPNLPAKEYFNKIVSLDLKTKYGCAAEGGSGKGCHGPTPQGTKPKDDRSKELTYLKAKEYLLSPKRVAKEDNNILINALTKGEGESGKKLKDHKVCSSLMVSPCREIVTWFKKETTK